MRKWIYLGITIIFGMLLVACQSEDKDNYQAILEAAAQTIQMPETVESDLGLMTEITYLGNKIDIVWTSSRTDVMSHTGEVIRPDASGSDVTLTLTAVFSLEGQTHQKTYSITVRKAETQTIYVTMSFETNGGQSISSFDIEKGTSFNQDITPNRSGYVFVGWYLDEAFNEPLQLPFIAESHTIFYAKWQAEHVDTYVSVHFDTQGGTSLNVLEGISEGESIDSLPTPTKENHNFLGWYKDLDFNQAFELGTLLYENITLYAKWEAVIIETFVVTFHTDGGTTIPNQEVTQGSFVTEPSIPEKSGYAFLGWAIDSLHSKFFDFASDTVESDLTLYAKWSLIEIVPEGIPIYTADEFNLVSNQGANQTYYLANDIDFSNHTWVYKNYNFRGTINGNGKTLSNLTIHGTDRTGLFSRVNQFTIYDLTIVNPTITSTNRAGVLFGENDGDQIQVYNIHIIGANLTGGSSNGTGGLIGYTKAASQFTIENIIIEDSIIHNTQSASGGLIGMTDGTTLTIKDIHIKNVTVTSNSGRVGGLYGEIKGTPHVSISHVVLEVDLSAPDYVGGLIGRNQVVSGLTVNHVFLTGKMASSSRLGSITSDKVISQIDKIFGAGIDLTGSASQQNITTENYVAQLEMINQEWWHDYLSEIASSPSWIFMNHRYQLIGQSAEKEDHLKVTLEIGYGQSQIHLFVKEHTRVVLPSIDDIYGYTFGGWYLDQTFQTPFDSNQMVETDIMLYAKWIAKPTYEVVINGIIQMVIEHEIVDQPSDPYQVGKVFLGWFIGEIPYDFNQGVTTNLVITALFRDAETFEITFESYEGSEVSSLTFYENEVITNLPKPHLEGYRFLNWYLDASLTQVFSSSYLTQDLILYAKYAELGMSMFEEHFDYTHQTLLKDTIWQEMKPGVAIITDGALRLTEQSVEATYEQSLSQFDPGRYVLVFDFTQGIGGASFTIELLSQTTRVFTVGANRQNRFTYRNSDGSETAVASSIMQVTPNVKHQAVIIFDTIAQKYTYYVVVGDDVLEVTPSGGVSFASSLEMNRIRIRTVGHSGNPSPEPFVILDQLIIESTSETIEGKSPYDIEPAIDYEAVINQIYDELTIPFHAYTVSNLFLTKQMYNVSITWTSLNTSVITHEGIITRDAEDDIHVTMVATISKMGITRTKEFEVLVKAINGSVVFNDDHYSLTGFALDHVSIPNLKEGDPGYFVVYNEKDFLDAIAAENTSTTHAARIIEIRADLYLGYNEVTAQYGSFGSVFTSHATPKMHPILKQTGVGKIVIQDRDGSRSKYNEGLVIFSESGHTIHRGSFQIKRANNIVIRNLKFDHLWEWDEATKGDYDSNDWDYFTIEQVHGIWFDHIELGKAYDGLIDFKAGSNTAQTVRHATMSYMNLVFEPNDFILAQFEYLEANRTSYNYYNQMRNAGMSMAEIMALNSFQKKGFLLGGSEGRVGNIFTLTIYNSYIKNLQDRFPRLRGGDVHIFNSIYDATDVYEMRNHVRALYPALFAKAEYNRQLTNQALVTTENGAILMENSIVRGVSQVIKSNQVGRDHPTMTGKYQVLNSLYVLGDYVFFGSSEDDQTPFVHANPEPKLDFSWTTIPGLSYSNYELIDVNVLEAYLEQAILGTTNTPFNWLSLSGKPIS